jgi:hypothetical protein
MKQQQEVENYIGNMSDEELNDYIKALGGRVWKHLPRANREADARQLQAEKIGTLREPHKPPECDALTWYVQKTQAAKAQAEYETDRSEWVARIGHTHE